MAITKYVGYVKTGKVGSKVEFDFEVDDDDLPDSPGARRAAIERAARDALFDSGVWEWGYTEAGE